MKNLQTPLALKLVEALCQLAGEAGSADRPGAGAVRGGGGEREEDTVGLLLRELRWMEHVENASALTTKLLEVLQVAPFSLQRDIIAYLPEVVPDEMLEDVTDKLKASGACLRAFTARFAE